jgi:hypothetical protein
MGMKMAMKLKKAKMVISRGLATQHPLKIAGILALGALLLARAAVQYAPESNNESGDHPSVDKVEALRIREMQRAADHQDDLQDMVRYWNQLEQNVAVKTIMKSNNPGTDLRDGPSLWMQPRTKPQGPAVVADRETPVQPRNESGINVQARRAAQRELIELGFATKEGEQFQASVAEADDAWQGKLLFQAGFTEQQVRNAQEHQREGDEEAEANLWFRLLVSLIALSELRRQGFADFQGKVNVAAADDAGFGDQLLHAGFTELQIQDAQRRQRQASGLARVERYSAPDESGSTKR